MSPASRAQEGGKHEFCMRGWRTCRLVMSELGPTIPLGISRTSAGSGKGAGHMPLCDAKIHPDPTALQFFGLFFFLIFIFERETECEQERGRQRGRRRTRSSLHVPSCLPGARRGARTHKRQVRDLSQSRTINRLSHPGSQHSTSVVNHPPQNCKSLRDRASLCPGLAQCPGCSADPQ